MPFCCCSLTAATCLCLISLPPLKSGPVVDREISSFSLAPWEDIVKAGHCSQDVRLWAR